MAKKEQLSKEETDSRRVRALLFAGKSHEDISRMLRISPAKFKKLYADDIETSYLENIADIISTFIETAKGGRGTAQQIFLLKALFGWSDSAPKTSAPLDNMKAKAIVLPESDFNNIEQWTEKLRKETNGKEAD